jgi:chemotaxis signal transduction protein
MCYYLEILKLRSWVGMDRLTPVWGLPCFVKGIIHAHEEIIPVFDLYRKLELPGICDHTAFNIAVLEINSCDLKVTLGVSVTACLEVWERDGQLFLGAHGCHTSARPNEIAAAGVFTGRQQVKLELTKVITDADILMIYKLKRAAGLMLATG